MCSLIANTDKEEEAARDQAVVQHLQDRAVHPLLVEREDAERHEAHVAHRAVRDQLLEVGLHDRHDRAVDDRDHGEGDDERRKVLRRLREERDRESEESVAAEFQQHASKDDGACGWRLHMRIREPGVEREHRHLDRKGERECAEGERLQRWIGDGAAQRDQVECAGPGAGCRLVAKGGGEDRHKHQQRADQRVEDKLDRGVNAICATPDADDQIHRDKDNLPEDVEEEEVE